MSLLKHISLIFLVLFSFGLLAQNETGHPILDKYNVFESGGKVYISCTISSGNTCNGIDVFRSEDSLYFDNIGNISGICGSSASPVTYDFVDENPIKNKTSYYKLELGGYGYTTVIAVKVIDTDGFEFQVRPNPANDYSIVYFENDFNNKFELILFNHSGNIILTKETTSNQFDLNTAALNKGLYFFSITKLSNSERVIGKLVVQH